MAVFTQVSPEECRTFLQAYDLGELIKLDPILQGIENSNFHLHTTQGRFILTLFEKRVAESDLPFFMGVMRALHAGGIACPQPIEARDSQALKRCNHRPAAITTFLEGRDLAPPAITADHCTALGTTLARTHRAGKRIALHRPNSLSLDGWQKLIHRIGPQANHITPGLAVELQQHMNHLRQHWPALLTQGIIHADLFPDNVFFDDTGTLSGVIDWYFACTDALLYELAIIINAWCFDTNHRFLPAHSTALCQAYKSASDLPESEWSTLPLLCEGAALRFLLTRAHDWLHPDPKALITPKDPKEYLTKWRFHREIGDKNAYGA